MTIRPRWFSGRFKALRACNDLANETFKCETSRKTPKSGCTCIKYEKGELISISADVPFNYDPWVIVPLGGPSAALMKSGCTITTAIAIDRVLALYFPVQYYKRSKR